MARGETPCALFGFAGARLRLKHGHDEFSVKRTHADQAVLGSPVKAFKLTVELAGTVLDAKTIEGTISAVGGPCSRRKPPGWKVTLNRKLEPPPAS